MKNPDADHRDFYVCSLRLLNIFSYCSVPEIVITLILGLVDLSYPPLLAAMKDQQAQIENWRYG
ncbi:MAG: hypothetical protein R3271_09600 [Methylophaga sp.]|uniref:hypothetical protein n=1 Tax=Methylophaga sp. TaxID=2024840 RepID=UPI00299E2B24|nr:hypothetical protein [Methylophaga sp.]MDX1750562.1 hypothetical protein [Methylophaga sp.]